MRTNYKEFKIIGRVPVSSTFIHLKKWIFNH